MSQHRPSSASLSETDDPKSLRSDPPSESAEAEVRAALSYDRELRRKGLHLLALIIPAGMLAMGRTWSLLLLVPLSVLALGADVLRARSLPFARFIHRVFGRMMRPKELPSIGGRPAVNGATWVVISATLLTLLFPMDLAAPVFAAFMVGDAAAAVAGLKLGRHRWPGSERTMEGTAAFAIVAFLCLLPFDHVSAAPAAAACLAGAAVEAPSWRLNDNVRVPLVMAVVLVLLGS